MDSDSKDNRRFSNEAVYAIFIMLFITIIAFIVLLFLYLMPPGQNMTQTADVETGKTSTHALARVQVSGCGDGDLRIEVIRMRNTDGDGVGVGQLVANAVVRAGRITSVGFSSSETHFFCTPSGGIPELHYADGIVAIAIMDGGLEQRTEVRVTGPHSETLTVEAVLDTKTSSADVLHALQFLGPTSYKRVPLGDNINPPHPTGDDLNALLAELNCTGCDD